MMSAHTPFIYLTDEDYDRLVQERKAKTKSTTN